MDEKEMIGSILDDETSESPPQSAKKNTKSKKLKLPSQKAITPIVFPGQDPLDSLQPFSSLHIMRTYSPPIQNKQNMHEFDLQLTPVPVMSSQPLILQPKIEMAQTQQFGVSDWQNMGSNIMRKYSQDEILEGDLIVKCKDQQNARSIQRIFQQGTLEQRDIIFNKLEKGLLILSKDVFGNYVIQNILEYGTSGQHFKFQTQLLSFMLQLSFHSYGCRVVQKALEVFHTTKKDYFYQIFEQIRNKVKELIIDNNGNHVVQKIIQLENQAVADWVVDGVHGQVKKLANNSFGCRIIQKTLSISNHNQIPFILDEIMVIAHDLCFSQFGNYIIQQLLQESPAEILEQIHKIILTRFEQLSLNKFGSNVVDQAIKYSNNGFKSLIIQVLLSSSKETGELVFLRLSNSAFGNYVVQNFFKQVDLDLQEDLYNKIVSDPQIVTDIQTSQFGQYVYQTLVKRQELLRFKLQ